MGSSSEGFNMKKTLATAAVGIGVLAGAGALAYFILESKIKEQHSQGKSSSDITVSDLSLRKSKSYANGLTDSAESLLSSKSFFSYCNTVDGYETAREMLSEVNSDSGDEFFDLNSDDENLAESFNKNLKIETRNKEYNLFNEVDTLMSGKDNDKERAFNILRKHEFEMTENPEFLWRFAKAHQIRASFHSSENEIELKKKLVWDGLELATKALALDSENPNSHKWYAILTGMHGDFLSIKEKIEKAKVFYEHVLLALELKPNDYSLHYLVGRFKYEIANTSWWERKIAASLFGELPSFTYDEAIPHLLNSEKLNASSWKENRLLLAKCFIGNGNYDKALEWLDAAEKIPAKTREDEVCHREIEDLIVKYQSYRK